MKWRLLLLLGFICGPLVSKSQSNPAAVLECPNINWATWRLFSGRKVTGSVVGKDGTTGLTLTSSVNVIAANEVFRYQEAFGRYPLRMPNKTVPKTTWTSAEGTPGTTTICFSKPVKNPVLMVASLGGDGRAALKFSAPYVTLYREGKMQFTSSTTMAGDEGNAVIVFPGEFTCISIVSSTSEKTYISFGLAECKEPPPPPPPPVPPTPKPPMAAVKPNPKPPLPKPVVVAPPVIPKPVPKPLSIPADPPIVNTGAQLTIWDYDCVDFDSVSITLNGKQIGPKAIQLSAFRKFFNLPASTFLLDLQYGENMLEITALNEGVNPYNSVGVFIINGKSRNQLYYKLKVKQSAVIQLPK